MLQDVCVYVCVCLLFVCCVLCVCLCVRCVCVVYVYMCVLCVCVCVSVFINAFPFCQRKASAKDRFPQYYLKELLAGLTKDPLRSTFAMQNRTICQSRMHF